MEVLFPFQNSWKIIIVLYVMFECNVSHFKTAIKLPILVARCFTIKIGFCFCSYFCCAIWFCSIWKFQVTFLENSLHFFPLFYFFTLFEYNVFILKIPVKNIHHLSHYLWHSCEIVDNLELIIQLFTSFFYENFISLPNPGQIVFCTPSYLNVNFVI